MHDQTAPPPLVSIVVPAYKPHFIRACLKSAQAQTYRDIEIVVSDDCPDDKIAEACGEFKNLKYSRNPRPGHYSNFDRCIALAEGSLIKFLFDDDLLEPNCVSEMVAAFLSNNTPVALVACRYHQIDEAGRFLARRGFEVEHTVNVLSDAIAVKSILFHTTNFIGSLSSTLFPRALTEELGPEYFTRRMRGGARGLSDVAFYFDIRNSGDVIYLDRTLVQFRLSRFNLSNADSNVAAQLTLTAWEELLMEAGESSLLSATGVSHAVQTLVQRYKRLEGRFPELVARRERLTRRSM